MAPRGIELALFHTAIPEVKFKFPGGNFLVDELVEMQAPRSRSLTCARSQAANRANLGGTHIDGIGCGLRKIFPNRNLDVRFADLAALALVGGEIKIEGKGIGRRAAVATCGQRDGPAGRPGRWRSTIRWGAHPFSTLRASCSGSPTPCSPSPRSSCCWRWPHSFGPPWPP